MNIFRNNVNVGKEKGNGTLRVVVADDVSKSLQTTSALLRKHFEIVAEESDGVSALHAILELKPDVAVLDLSMPGLNGIEVARKATMALPRLAVIICTVHRDPQVIEAALEAGVVGYVSKMNMCRDLVRAVETVSRGDRFVPEALGLVKPLH